MGPLQGLQQFKQIKLRSCRFYFKLIIVLFYFIIDFIDLKKKYPNEESERFLELKTICKNLKISHCFKLLSYGRFICTDVCYSIKSVQLYCCRLLAHEEATATESAFPAAAAAASQHDCLRTNDEPANRQDVPGSNYCLFQLIIYYYFLSLLSITSALLNNCY